MPCPLRRTVTAVEILDEIALIGFETIAGSPFAVSVSSGSLFPLSFIAAPIIVGHSFAIGNIFDSTLKVGTEGTMNRRGLKVSLQELRESVDCVSSCICSDGIPAVVIVRTKQHVSSIN